MAYLGYPPLFFAGPILSFNAFVSQLEKPILSYTAGPSQSEQLVVEREEVVGCRLFFRCRCQVYGVLRSWCFFFLCFFHVFSLCGGVGGGSKVLCLFIFFLGGE